MARIQILELPDGIGDERPPFAVILDELTGHELDVLGESREGIDTFKQNAGAAAILAVPFTVQIPSNLVPVDEDGNYAGPPVRMPVQADLDGFRDQVEQAVTDARHRLDDAVPEHRGGDTREDAWTRQALERVRALPEMPQTMHVDRPYSDDYFRGYGHAIRTAKSATYEPESADKAVRPRPESL